MQNKSLYQSFLILEFVALAVLLASMFWIAQLAQDGETLTVIHRLLPTIASGLTLTGFLGAMYIRWLGAAETVSRPKRVPFILFWVLTLTLFVVWLYAAAQWMLSSGTLPPAN